MDGLLVYLVYAIPYFTADDATLFGADRMNLHNSTGNDTFAEMMRDMEKKSNHNERRSDANVACEPVMEYHAMEGDVAYLPDDILVAAVKCADISRQHGELVPHDKVYSVLARRLRWK